MSIHEFHDAEVVLQANCYSRLAYYFFDLGFAIHIHTMDGIGESSISFDTKEALIEAAIADLANDEYEIEKGEIPCESTQSLVLSSG